ncbi:GNAT family N-acetyltransferase [Streptomyces sp. JV178]|uniref:GNAT family N-acetyltransferase n=1 Tax=Streptomyces sp. JV178 TaxID=858632 RepID=UPI000C1B4346|nr:GNAT family N-acetyltransferase [Streptomyces sp. JV178]PIM69643.1 GNAT family N-acetyltransferase [Streptomyces sp. JV178]
MSVRVFKGADALAHTDALRSVYVDVFRASPWNEDDSTGDALVRRLAGDVTRGGFTAALAFAGAEVAGFATAWTTQTPFPTGRCYPQVAAGLGSERTADWLCGALEIDELAVRPGARGRGVAGELLAAVTADVPGGRSWLLTSNRSLRAVSFSRHRDWTQATRPSPDGQGIVVFLGPRHPARSLAALPSPPS